MASNRAATTGVRGRGDGLAATKFWIMLANVEGSRPCRKDSRMVSRSIDRRVLRLWLGAGVDTLERAVPIDELLIVGVG